jgi:hypothetical protein
MIETNKLMPLVIPRKQVQHNKDRNNQQTKHINNAFLSRFKAAKRNTHSLRTTKNTYK